MRRLTAYFLAFQIIWIALFGLADNGQGAIALLVQLALTPFTLVLGLRDRARRCRRAVEGVRRSLRVCRARPRETILVVLVLLLLVALTLVAFSNGFTDASHVQPSYLVAWLLVGVLLGLPERRGAAHRCTAATPLSEAGSADPAGSDPSAGSFGLSVRKRSTEIPKRTAIAVSVSPFFAR